MNTIKWYDDVSFEHGVDIKALLQDNHSKEIRIIIPKGEVLKEHKAPGAIIVQVLRGKIWFEVYNEKYEFEAGDMLDLDALVPHSLGGLEDSIVRLSLSVLDNVERVEKLK